MPQDVTPSFSFTPEINLVYEASSLMLALLKHTTTNPRKGEANIGLGPHQVVSNQPGCINWVHLLQGLSS
jgi:hypothetical protein